MNCIELARKALKSIKGTCFPCWIYGGDWDNYEDLDLSAEEILYLIKMRNGNESVFEGFTVEETDVDTLITAKAKEGAWPDGGPQAEVNSIIPEELTELSDDLSELDMEDESAVEAMRERLRSVADGDYTFSFTIMDGGCSYYFAENAEEGIHLTREEALGLLKSEHDRIDAIQGGGCKVLDEDFINEKAEKMGFADEYDRLNYGGRCDSIEQFVSAWDVLLDLILEGEVTEENLDKWLAYFDDSDNYETDIKEWFEESVDE